MLERIISWFKSKLFYGKYDDNTKQKSKDIEPMYFKDLEPVHFGDKDKYRNIKPENTILPPKPAYRYYTKNRYGAERGVVVLDSPSSPKKSDQRYPVATRNVYNDNHAVDDMENDILTASVAVVTALSLMGNDFEPTKSEADNSMTTKCECDSHDFNSSFNSNNDFNPGSDNNFGGGGLFD